MARLENIQTLPTPSLYPAQELVNYAIHEANIEYPHVDFIQANMGKNMSIRIHREYFLMIMRVLLENAVKYSINSNRVTIDFFGGYHKRDVFIKVTNWGVYIPEGEKERIFERYYRARNV